MPSLLEILGILLEFIPQVFVLYFILALFEKSGVLGKFAQFFHLPVNNVLPICLTFNCTTMAICAARDNPYRKNLVYFLSLIPCTAQLPLLTFLLLTVIKFPLWSIFLLYFVAIFIGIIFLLILPRNKKKNEYYQNVIVKWPNIWECCCDTLKQTIIFAKKIFIAFAVSAFVIVFLARFSFHFKFVSNPEESILFSICGFFTPLFTPIGLNQPVVICALLFGIIAKEAAVSVLLFFPNIVNVLTIPVVLSLVTFFTFYPKCLAAQTAINHHCGRKTGWKVFFMNLLLAYSLSFVVYNLCGFFI